MSESIRLVVMPTAESRLRQLEVSVPIVMTTEIVTTRDPIVLEKYGQTWAKFWNTDIVMLVEE